MLRFTISNMANTHTQTQALPQSWQHTYTHTYKYGYMPTCSRWQARHTLLLTKSITKYLRRKLLYISAYLSVDVIVVVISLRLC